MAKTEKLNKPDKGRTDINPAGAKPVVPQTVEEKLDLANAKIASLKEQAVLQAAKLLADSEAAKKVVAEETVVLKALKPNMYDDAAKTVSDFKGVSVPKVIDPREAGHYHMLAIVSEADLKTKKFYFVTRHVKFTVQGYERHRKSYAGVAEEDWIMFHNPTLVKK